MSGLRKVPMQKYRIKKIKTTAPYLHKRDAVNYIYVKLIIFKRIHRVGSRRVPAAERNNQHCNRKHYH